MVAPVCAVMLQLTQIADGAFHDAARPGPQARVSGLEVRLATNRREIDAARALRYRVFRGETNATPSAAKPWRERGIDAVAEPADTI